MTASLAPLIGRLETSSLLSSQELAEIAELEFSLSTHEAGAPIDADFGGQALLVILEGIACRMRYFDDGRRQVTGFLMPGDICALPDCVAHQPEAAGPVTIARISYTDLFPLFARYPGLTTALWVFAQAELQVAREWSASLGRRTAEQRMAHLFCEFYVRGVHAGIVRDGHFTLPLNQQMLADCLGLSLVHANRTLQKLRRAGLVSVRGKNVHIPCLKSLAEAGEFHADYIGYEAKAQAVS